MFFVVNDNTRDGEGEGPRPTGFALPSSISFRERPLRSPYPVWGYMQDDHGKERCKSVAGSSAKIVEIFPELLPGLAQMTAKQDIGVVLAFFILNAIRVSIGADNGAGFEEGVNIGWLQSQDDDGLGRRVAIPP